MSENKSPVGVGRRSGAAPARPRQPTAAGDQRLRVALAVFVALGIGLGYSLASRPDAAKPAAIASATTTPVRSATVACPIVTGASDASISAYSPQTAAAGSATPGGTGSAATVTALGSTNALLNLTHPGSVDTATGQSGAISDLSQESVPFIGRANGAMAPGFTATEILSSGSVGTYQGLAATPCTAPATNLWFLGTELGVDQSAEFNLVNTDALPAQVNLSGYTASGPLSSSVMAADQGLVVGAQSQYTGTIDLTQLTDASSGGGAAGAAGAGSNPAAVGAPLAVDMTATSGRVAAALLDSDGSAGRDFILPQQPAAHLVLPGIPAPTAGAATPMKLELILLAPTQDTGVRLKWIGHSTITPMVTIPHLIAGQVRQVDISSVPEIGESGALRIDSTNGAPILAEIKVTAAGGSDTAYLSPVPELTGESIVAANTAGSIIELTNAGTAAAQVSVTAQGGSAPAVQTVSVPAGTTVPVTVPAPAGASIFAVCVVPLGGAPSVYAARIMTASGGQLTIQPMSTALEDVQVPAVSSNLSGTVPQA